MVVQSEGTICLYITYTGEEEMDDLRIFGLNISISGRSKIPPCSTLVDIILTINNNWLDLFLFFYHRSLDMAGDDSDTYYVNTIAELLSVSANPGLERL